MQAQIIFWSVLAAVVALDLWSKKVVFAWLESKPQTTVTLIDGLLELVRRENPGAAFGIAVGQRGLLILVSLAALATIVGSVFLARPGGRLLYVMLGLFGGGVLGNLYDRLFYDGKVRDFIDLHYGRWHWPAFNVADTVLCIAIGLWFISLRANGRQHSSTDKPAQEPSPPQR
jgi:signal peptidase II